MWHRSDVPKRICRRHHEKGRVAEKSLNFWCFMKISSVQNEGKLFFHFVASWFFFQPTLVVDTDTNQPTNQLSILFRYFVAVWLEVSQLMSCKRFVSPTKRLTSMDRRFGGSPPWKMGKAQLGKEGWKDLRWRDSFLWFGKGTVNGHYSRHFRRSGWYSTTVTRCLGWIGSWGI